VLFSKLHVINFANWFIPFRYSSLISPMRAICPTTSYPLTRWPSSYLAPLLAVQLSPFKNKPCRPTVEMDSRRHTEKTEGCLQQCCKDTGWEGLERTKTRRKRYKWIINCDGIYLEDTQRYGVATHKTSIGIFTAVRISNFIKILNFETGNKSQPLSCLNLFNPLKPKLV
jgi:hypothetical protein